MINLQAFTRQNTQIIRFSLFKNLKKLQTIKFLQNVKRFMKKVNYVKPNKEDYRVKRSENFYQKYDEPSIAREIKTEYKKNYK